MTMKDIGATIKAIRSERGVAASDFAGAVGMSQEEIDRLESGEEGFRSATLIEIAKALKIPPFRLFTWCLVLIEVPRLARRYLKQGVEGGKRWARARTT